MRFPSCFLPALLIVAVMAPAASAEVNWINDMFLWLPCDDEFHGYPNTPMDLMLNDNANNYDVSVTDQHWFNEEPPYSWHTETRPGKVNSAAYFGSYSFAAGDGGWYPHGFLHNDPAAGYEYDDIYWLDKPEATAPSSKVTVATWINADYIFDPVFGDAQNATIFHMQDEDENGRISLRVKGVEDVGAHSQGAAIEFQLGGNDGTEIINFVYGDEESEYLSPDAVVGEWLHVAATYDKDADIAELYLNGTKVADMEISSNINICNSNDDWHEAYWRWDHTWQEGTHAFFGYMDEFYIYNRALSAEDVAFLASIESTPGNTDLDTDVDLQDLLTAIENYGQLSGCEWEDGDFDGDGDVDGDDIAWLAVNMDWTSIYPDPDTYCQSNDFNGYDPYNWEDPLYQQKVDDGVPGYMPYPFPDPITNTATVPEPSTLIMLAGALALLAALRFRKAS